MDSGLYLYHSEMLTAPMEKQKLLHHLHPELRCGVS
jgi:hypothetical protein